MQEANKIWHLAQNEDETDITEFELQLLRTFYTFICWPEECEKCVSGIELTGNDLAILHIIRMNDKPKTINNIGRLLNRNDSHNLRYSIKKLLDMGLIKKNLSDKGSNKNFLLEITEKGIKDTDTYTKMRNTILIDLFKRESDLNLKEIAKSLVRIKSIYDEATYIATSSPRPVA